MDNLTIVVPFYNGHRTINTLLNSLPAQIPVVIVNDCSDDGLLYTDIERIQQPDYTHNIHIHNLDQKGYFAGAVNAGIQACQTDVLVLNQDTWFENHHAFALLESHRSHFGMIGERIRGTHPAFGDLGYIHGTFMFLRRDALAAVGLLDQKRYPLWGNTAEYQWRVARQNFEVLPLVDVPGFHHQRPAGERYGSSIKELLDKTPAASQKELLVRTPPLLSVIVPCYNYGRYLSDCINSLIGGKTSLGQMSGQTLQSFEIIIVDDASTDDSADYINEIASLPKGIRAYRMEKNSGTARTLNYGIQQAVGKYITFLSADDMRESDSLEKLVEVCEKNPHSFAYDDVWIVTAGKRAKQWRIEEYDFEKLIWKNQIHAGIVFPRRAWEDVGGYPDSMGNGREDWAFNVALGVRGWCGIHLHQFGYLYRREGQNRTLTNTTPKHRAHFLEKMKQLFPALYRGERPVACCGKGAGPKNSNVARNRTTTTTMMTRSLLGGSTIMASNRTLTGSGGMSKVEYLGKQMSSTWSGDVTNTTYTFGVDRRKGWIDKRDLGSRDPKRGFLGKQDRATGEWLFRDISEKSETSQESVPTVQPVEESAQTVQSDPAPQRTEEDTAAVRGSSQAQATPSVKQAEVEYDPATMNVVQIKTLVDKNLSKEQWVSIYKAELAGSNRKGAVTFIEDLLANWTD